MFLRAIISQSFLQKYQSQDQLLNLETYLDVFLGLYKVFPLPEKKFDDYTVRQRKIVCLKLT